MNILIRTSLLLSMISLAACMQTAPTSSSSDKPEWITGEPDMYPNFKYLSATGSSSRSEQAKARALSNLSKIIEVQVREVSTNRQDIQSFEADGTETVTRNRRSDSTVNLKTDTILQGARIAEQWQSSADLTHYALAVLDRQQAGNNLRSEMQRLDDETAYVLEQRRNDSLLAIADLNKANTLQRDRQTLQKTMKVIDVRGEGVPAKWNLAELDERLSRELRGLPVQARVGEDDVGGMGSVLQGAVSAAGFNPGSSGYSIVASVDALKPFRKDDWYWQRGTLKLELVSADGLTVIGHQSWPLKVSGSDPGQLPARMRSEADRILKTELLETMLGFAG